MKLDLDADLTALLPNLPPILARGNARDSALYFRQLYQLLHAGVSISAALSALEEVAPSHALRAASREMRRRIDGKTTWAQAMRECQRQFPGQFSDLTIALIEAAEIAGFLPQACLSIAKFAEDDYAVQQKIKVESYYPKFLLFFSTLVVPIPIRIGFLGQNYIIDMTAQIVIIGTLWGIWKAANYAWPYLQGSEFQLKIDRFRLGLPLVGKTIRGFAFAKFCRVLAMSNTAGVNWTQGVELAAIACGNTALRDDLLPACARLQGGHTLTQALQMTGEVPAAMLPLLHSGEMSGELSSQLDSIAVFLESDAKMALHQSVVALCLAIFLLVAIKIGIQVVQFHAR
jgi:type II secretory pathway component PulF